MFLFICFTKFFQFILPKYFSRVIKLPVPVGRIVPIVERIEIFMADREIDRNGEKDGQAGEQTDGHYAKDCLLVFQNVSFVLFYKNFDYYPV